MLRFIFRNKIGIELFAHLTRKRNVTIQEAIEVGFTGRSYKKGRLCFDNRKITIYTLTLLKSLTIEALKQRTVRTMKREWRYLPQFRVDFQANLKTISGG